MTTTPTKNESLPELVARWREQAGECRAYAARLGEGHSAHNEILRDAAQYEQTAHQVEAALTREAPTEGVGIRGEVTSVGICGMASICVDYTYYGPHILSVGDKFTLLNDKATTTPPAPQRLAQGEDGRPKPWDCPHRFGTDPRVCLQCGWNFRENGDAPTQPPHHDRGEVEARAVLADQFARLRDVYGLT